MLKVSLAGGELEGKGGGQETSLVNGDEPSQTEVIHYSKPFFKTRVFEWIHKGNKTAIKQRCLCAVRVWSDLHNIPARSRTASFHQSVENTQIHIVSAEYLDFGNLSRKV